MYQRSTRVGAERSPAHDRLVAPVAARVLGPLHLALAVSLVAAGLLVPAGAGAQAEYEVAGPIAMPYEPLSPHAVPAPASFMNLDWSVPTSSEWDRSHWVVALPSDFTFRYWGDTFTHLSIGGNGGIKALNTGNPNKASINGVNYRAYALGYANDYVRGAIAPWWTDWARGTQSPHPGGLYYEVVGEKPNRVFKVEWRNVQHYSCGTANPYPSSTSYIINNCPNQTSYSFQVWLAETPASSDLNSSIIFAYGTPIGPPPANEPMGGIPTGYNYGTNSYQEGATVGIVKPGDNTSYFVPEAFRGCSERPTQANYDYYGDCRVESDWPAEQAIVFTNKADVIVARVQGPTTGWSGYPATFSAVVRNVGAKGAAATRVQFFGSTDRVLSDDDFDLGTTTQALPVGKGQEVVFHHEAALPVGLEPGSDYYVLARVDPEGVVDEDVRVNNVGASPVIVVGEPTPDLAVGEVIAPAEAPIGGSFDLSWVARNLGNLPVEDVSYVVVLSDNDVIAPNDLQIHQDVVSVDALSSTDVSARVQLPEDLQAGAYYLGVILDPQQEVYELDEQNNVGASAQTFNATADSLVIRTVDLPAAELGSPWSTRLQGSGGDGTYTWTVQRGALPPGLELQDIRFGDQVVGTALAGVPARIGTYAFWLRMESAGLYLVQPYEMEVLPAGLDLAITSTGLPNAVVLEEYPTALAAVGGQAPYTWTVVGGSLPQGVRLAADGSFSGRPTEDGVFAFTVRLEDAAGAVAEAGLELTVQPARSIRCLTRTLPDIQLGQEFSFQLAASGGTAPYTWSTVESRRIATELDPGDFWDHAPTGLTLADDGRIRTVPAHMEAGSYVWQVQVRGADSLHAARCTLAFEVGYDRGLTITTRALRDAWAGVPYEVELVSSGGEAPVKWKLHSGTLPPGFELREDGTLSGRLEVAELAGERQRSWDFSVRARDLRNRTTSSSFRLTVRAEQPTWEEPDVGEPVTEGCQSAGGAPGILAALAVLGLAALRRRD